MSHENSIEADTSIQGQTTTSVDGDAGGDELEIFGDEKEYWHIKDEGTLSLDSFSGGPQFWPPTRGTV